MSPLTCLIFFLEFICFYIVFQSFLANSLVPQKEDMIAVLSILLILSFIPKEDTIFIWGVGQFLYLLYALYKSHFAMFHGILLFLLTEGLLIGSQIIIAMILSAAHICIYGNYSDIIGNILTFVFLCLLFRFSIIKTLYSRIITSALAYRLILVNSFFILTAILIVWKQTPSDLFTTITYSSLIILFLISMNIAVLYYDKLSMQQKKELQSYENSLLLYKDLITEIQANQHEYSHRLQTLQNLPLLYHDYVSLCNALATHAEEYSKPLHIYPLLQLDMPLPVAALYHQFCIAEKQNISIQFDVTALNLHTSVPQQDLTDYVCILMQNAIEACSNGDNIYVNITQSNKYISFEIRNPITHNYTPNELQQLFQKGYSTKSCGNSKSNSRGLGLYYLLKKATKHDIRVQTNCIVNNSKNWIIFKLDVPTICNT